MGWTTKYSSTYHSSSVAGMIAERDSDLKELHENLDELLKDFSGVAGILVDDPLVEGVAFKPYHDDDDDDDDFWCCCMDRRKDFGEYLHRSNLYDWISISSSFRILNCQSFCIKECWFSWYILIWGFPNNMATPTAGWLGKTRPKWTGGSPFLDTSISWENVAIPPGHRPSALPRLGPAESLAVLQPHRRDGDLARWEMPRRGVRPASTVPRFVGTQGATPKLWMVFCIYYIYHITIYIYTYIYCNMCIYICL